MSALSQSAAPTITNLRASGMRANVSLPKCFDCIPVEDDFLGNRLDGVLTPAAPGHFGKALALEGFDRRDIEPRASTVAKTQAPRLTHLDCQKNVCEETPKFADRVRTSVFPDRPEPDDAPADAHAGHRTRAKGRTFNSRKTFQALRVSNKGRVRTCVLQKLQTIRSTACSANCVAQAPAPIPGRRFQHHPQRRARS